MDTYEYIEHLINEEEASYDCTSEGLDYLSIQPEEGYV